MKKIDFSQYSDERIGMAYCRMNCFQWDKMFGKPPRGWKNMTNATKAHNPAFRAYMDQLEDHLGEEKMSGYWWTLKLGRTWEEWDKWYHSRMVYSLSSIRNRGRLNECISETNELF